MAATPPRPASPAPRPRPVAIPKPGHNLQISPNLEALLQHDELTRRNSSSPTSWSYSSPSSEFPISLPLPPPRKANGGRKAGHEPVPIMRSREGQRSRSTVVGSDLWPDALSGTTSPPDGTSAAGQSTSGVSSRPVTPNPYLNPAPVLEPINTPDMDALADEAPTPKQADRSLPSEPPRSSAETRGRPSTSDPSHRPSNPLHKVEKILSMGRDSLSLFSSSANGVKRDSDRRNDRTGSPDLDAVQDRQMRQVPVAPTQSVPRPASRFGDIDTATVSLSSKPGSSYPHALQQGSHGEPSEASSHSARFDSGPANSLPHGPPPAAYLLPRLSLPSIFMSSSSSQRPRSADDVAGSDYLSFIDFFSPSTFDERNPTNIQDGPQETSPCRRQPPPISIPSPSLYSMSHDNLSSGSLPSMRFAPPSPTSLAVQQPSPTYAGSVTSSPVTLSTMIFAPPSPFSEHAPARLQPLSDPPSPYSPLEFAPPPSLPHETTGEPPLPRLSGLARERGRMLKSKSRSKSTSPYLVHAPISPLPPTTNSLNANERADRIRRNRKLARVFGRIPGVEDPVTDAEEPRVSKKLHPPALAALLTKQKSHRHAVSVSVSVKTPGMKTEPSTPWESQEVWAPDGRRHSTPLATNFTLYMDDERNGTPSKSRRRPRKPLDSPDAASTRSFIDLSEDVRDDDVSELSCFSLHQNKHHRLHHSNSTPSFVESLDPEARAEIEKRQKREKLARLHRFLGSRVPPEAVNGSVFGPPLPPPAPVEEPDRDYRLRGNKNARQNDFDRGKEELDEREKALNVRRAQKMERVFGTTPPQMLFHTRRTPALSQPTSPADPNPFVLTLDIPSTSRNPNQSAYMGKTLYRPGPSDSSRCLLPWREDTPQSSPSSSTQSFADSFAESPGYQQVLAQSTVYLNYQHSLNSLVDIIDRDDRQSLLELHRFLHGEADDCPSEEEAPVNPRRLSSATSVRSERRHSLPSNASMTSLSSEYYASPMTSRFQIRRRQAAKLTNFFGVDYCVLIHDVLESIEKGVEEESKRGTLQPQEAEVLMHRVRSLRSMKDPFGTS